jgi:hypothetical protein
MVGDGGLFVEILRVVAHIHDTSPHLTAPMSSVLSLHSNQSRELESTFRCTCKESSIRILAIPFPYLARCSCGWPWYSFHTSRDGGWEGHAVVI